MTMRWLTTRRRRSNSSPASPASSHASTTLCAEALTGIADPLFPALAGARIARPDDVARVILGGLVEPLESPAPADAMPTWLLPHQADAVARARGILARFGGVLVADGVGLGKTHIALALAALERARGGDAIALVPAALRDEWRRAAEAVAVPIRLCSHTELAGRRPALLPRCTLLLVDEAHAFRNPRTRRYDGLARLAAGRHVALLTATPVNNTPADLASLVHLFAARDRFRAFGVADLPRALRAGDPAAALALAAITVCRTRRSIETCFPELRPRFPRRVLEPPIRFDLDAACGGRLEALLAALNDLLTAQGPLERGAVLMHLGLLRRLESSRAALRRSLLRHRDFLAEIERAAREGVVLTRAAYRTAVPRRDDDDAQLVLWSLLAGSRAPEPVRRDIAACRDAVERALATLEVPENHGPADAKVAALDAALAGPLAGRKTIVFTEYRDTALALLRHLRRHHRVAGVAGDRAWAGAAQVSRAEALDAFAPAARNRRADPLMSADVLIATDVAGEGLNLQDGEVVINYDLPWNPVRVMQRVGRVDRLASPHAEIRVAHVVPAGGLALLTGVLRRIRVKLEAGLHLPGAEPDPLAALWWVGEGILSAERIERESWRRVAPFEARERWRSLAGRTRPGTHPVVAAGIACDDGPPQAGVLLALEWPDGSRVSLPFVATAGAAPRRDPDALGALAERAIGSAAMQADPAAFTTLMASVLPDARCALVTLSAARHGIDEVSPGRLVALDVLHREAAESARERRGTATLDAALKALEHEVPVGLDRMLGKLAAAPHANGNLASRITELLQGTASDSLPAGAPRLVLVAAIVLASRCPTA